jgi:outer membrane protein assembly factor BamA
MTWIELAVGYLWMPAQSRVKNQRIGLNRLCNALTLASMLACCAQLPAQSTSQHSAEAKQLPKTAPATAIEIAGRPGLDASQLTPLFQQHAGQPFAKAKIDSSIAALKATGKFGQVQLQVEPEAKGVRVLLILEPAIWFGIFEFPGAERFPYSKLVQIANYPPQAPYNAWFVSFSRRAILKPRSVPR